MRQNWKCGIKKTEEDPKKDLPPPFFQEHETLEAEKPSYLLSLFLDIHSGIVSFARKIGV